MSVVDGRDGIRSRAVGTQAISVAATGVPVTRIARSPRPGLTRGGGTSPSTPRAARYAWAVPCADR